MTYAICFDFPDAAGDPLFAGWLKDGGIGFSPTLEKAARFETELVAERVLANSFGSAIGEFGSVVEVAT